MDTQTTTLWGLFRDGKCFTLYSDELLAKSYAMGDICVQECEVVITPIGSKCANLDREVGYRKLMMDRRRSDRGKGGHLE